LTGNHRFFLAPLIFEAVWGFAVTRVLTAAVDLDVFTAIARGHHPVDDLVKDRSCSERGLAMLLHALTPERTGLDI